MLSNISGTQIGMARLADPFGLLNEPYRRRKSSKGKKCVTIRTFKNDIDAQRGDWEKVGESIFKSINAYSER